MGSSDEPLFPHEEDARERALERFGIDIEVSLRTWFDDMGLTEERVEEILARANGGVHLGPGRASREELELSPRQREVLSYFACGYTRTEIGDRLGVHWETVKRHADAARFRLKASTLAQAVIVAALVGELDMDIVRDHLLRNWDI